MFVARTLTVAMVDVGGPTDAEIAGSTNNDLPSSSGTARAESMTAARAGLLRHLAVAQAFAALRPLPKPSVCAIESKIRRPDYLPLSA
jgi:hypothetical protein